MTRVQYDHHLIIMSKSSPESQNKTTKRNKQPRQTHDTENYDADCSVELCLYQCINDINT